MRKTTKCETANPMAVDLEELAHKLGCGKETAKEIGDNAGARIRIGRRVIYKISLVDEYLDKMAAEQADGRC